MEQIKSISKEKPNLAIAMLDSIELDVRKSSEYVQNKYDLLRVCLLDRAFIPPVSDFMITKLVKYFGEEGSAVEKQEVHYYAGSTYRDLHDTPRALEHFFKSIDYAIENSDCDSIMLRNAYSNLSFLQFRVQNYRDAVIMANKEKDLSQRLGDDDVISYMHVGSSYKALDSLEQSIAAYDKAFEILIQAKDRSKYQEDYIRLLLDYSSMNQIAKAQMCKCYITDTQTEKYLGVLKNVAFARYYEACEKEDSAVFYYNRVIEDQSDTDNMYYAARHLYHIYKKFGNVAKAIMYADAYMQLSDSLDFGKRQMLAATVNNVYQYHLDEKKERKLIEGKEKFRIVIIIVFFAFVAIIAVLSMLYIRRRNLLLKKIIMLSSQLEQISTDDKRLREDIENKIQELQNSEKLLHRTNKELNRIKQEFAEVNLEFNEYDAALKEKERLLAEKMEQNRIFIKLLNQSELEGKAEDVIYAIRQSAEGKKNMTSADWKQLYQAVDELYPNFKEILLEKLGIFTEQQMQVCYLMRIGLTKPQIQNMTSLSRVTVWRWVKKYDWVFNSINS